jgi:hypothetical protein
MNRAILIGLDLVRRDRRPFCGTAMYRHNSMVGLPAGAIASTASRYDWPDLTFWADRAGLNEPQSRVENGGYRSHPTEGAS